MKGLNKKEKEFYRENKKRVCKKCNKEKFFKDFSFKLEKNGKYYFQYECSKCLYQTRKQKYKYKIKEYIEKQRYNENFTINGRACKLRNHCKQRAKINNYDFNLTKQLIIDKLKIGICEKTGIKLILDDLIYNPYAPSIDRIDNNKGYTNDNIQITCMIYNFCKNKFTDEQVEKFFKDIKL